MCRATIAAYSSGAGGAGVSAALSYAALSSLLAPDTVLLIVCFVPLVLLVGYALLECERSRTDCVRNELIQYTRKYCTFVDVVIYSCIRTLYCTELSYYCVLERRDTWNLVIVDKAEGE